MIFYDKKKSEWGFVVFELGIVVVFKCSSDLEFGEALGGYFQFLVGKKYNLVDFE